MSCHSVSQPKIGTSFTHDLRTAFRHGQSFGVNRDVLCQLPPEACHLRYIAARSSSLKKPAYGMNDGSSTPVEYS